MVCCGVMWFGFVSCGAFGSLIGWFVGFVVGGMVDYLVRCWSVGGFVRWCMFGLWVGCWVPGWLVGWLGASTPHGVWCGVLLHGVRYGVRGCACMCSHCKGGGGGCIELMFLFRRSSEPF